MSYRFKLKLGSTRRSSRLATLGVAAVSLIFIAGCEDGGTVCGGLQGGGCTDNQYCAFEEGDLCGAADAAATCEQRPEVCAEIYAPVCACDGQTYGNACEAARAGSGVLHAGSCEGEGATCELNGTTYPDGTSGIPAGDGCNFCSCDDGRLACTLRACPEPVACGGRLGDTCTEEEYCAYEGGDCGFADGTSSCQPRPSGCPKNYDPVCGCDGETYDNACVAAAAGWGYLSRGPCTGSIQP